MLGKLRGRARLRSEMALQREGVLALL